ncbi:hypothetical protein AVEN_1179-1 [Araneus ventricosus]|uniref:Uncharacterized protein n=1 Tax=Araneus ventricosus TaxID=182803 RepID=A0A4Y2ECS9_ARAVE|nr:hypothetical protein AVEN_1179-1 [Araneus ventricosus]
MTFFAFAVDSRSPLGKVLSLTHTSLSILFFSLNPHPLCHPDLTQRISLAHFFPFTFCFPLSPKASLGSLVHSSFSTFLPANDVLHRYLPELHLLNCSVQTTLAKLSDFLKTVIRY